MSLNPFGTGKVFKQEEWVRLHAVRRLNPFGTGKVFKQFQRRKV